MIAADKMRPVQCAQVRVIVTVSSRFFADHFQAMHIIDETDPEVKRFQAAKTNREAADRLAANVLPIIQDIQKSRVTSLRTVATALTARGIPTARGGTWNLWRPHFTLLLWMADRLRGHDETIGERLKRDLTALQMPLPAPYDACEKVATTVSSLSLVRYRLNDYSAPTTYGPRDVLVRG